MASIYNFALDVQEDEETTEFMYRLIGGLIYAVANSPVLALNFYPILGELGTVSDRLNKMCRKWSPTLFKILKENSKPVFQRLNNRDEIMEWYQTVDDPDMRANLRLFVHQFVPLPVSLIDESIHQPERLDRTRSKKCG